MRFCVIGSGKMGFAYQQAVYRAGLSHKFEFYKRSKTSYSNDTYGSWDCLEDGLANQFYDSIVLAIPSDQYPSAIKRLEMYTKCFLLEKPGFASLEDFEFLNEWCNHSGRKIFVLFNRRFFSSIRHLKKLMMNTEKLYARFCFDDRISLLSDYTRPNELTHWVWFNSAHVIDLMFWLFDGLFDSQSEIQGSSTPIEAAKVPWHKGATIMRQQWDLGDKQVLVEADWSKDGSWCINGIADGEEFTLSPIEEFRTNKLALKPDFSDGVKPGLKEIVESIAIADTTQFASLEYCRKLYDQICKIAHY